MFSLDRFDDIWEADIDRMDVKKFDLSEKLCCCGGHNCKNVSRNLNHNSTKQRLSIKENRRFMEGQKV